MGRPTIGEAPMSGAQRMARVRELANAPDRQVDRALELVEAARASATKPRVQKALARALVALQAARAAMETASS